MEEYPPSLLEHGMSVATDAMLRSIDFFEMASRSQVDINELRTACDDMAVASRFMLKSLLILQKQMRDYPHNYPPSDSVNDR